MILQCFRVVLAGLNHNSPTSTTNDLDVKQEIPVSQDFSSLSRKINDWLRQGSGYIVTFHPGRNLSCRVKSANNHTITIDYNGIETAFSSSDYLDSKSIEMFESRFDFVRGQGWNRSVPAYALRN